MSRQDALSERIAEIIQHSIFKKTFIECHKLCNESLEMVDRLLAGLQSMLIERSCLCNFGFQLSVTIRHKLLQQSLQHTQLNLSYMAQPPGTRNNNIKLQFLSTPATEMPERHYCLQLYIQGVS